MKKLIFLGCLLTMPNLGLAESPREGVIRELLRGAYGVPIEQGANLPSYPKRPSNALPGAPETYGESVVRDSLLNNLDSMYQRKLEQGEPRVNHHIYHYDRPGYGRR